MRDLFTERLIEMTATTAGTQPIEGNTSGSNTWSVFAEKLENWITPDIILEKKSKRKAKKQLSQGEIRMEVETDRAEGDSDKKLKESVKAGEGGSPSTILAAQNPQFLEEEAFNTDAPEDTPAPVVLDGVHESMVSMSVDIDSHSSLPTVNSTLANDAIPLACTSRKSMTTVLQEEWKETYASSVLATGTGQEANVEDSDCPAVEVSHCVTMASTNTCVCSQSQSHMERNIPLEMAELMETVEDRMLQESRKDVQLPSDHIEDTVSEPDSSAGTTGSESEDEAEQEVEDFVEDIFLNNMERHWCGKDHLMEHVEQVASKNSTSESNTTFESL